MRTASHEKQRSGRGREGSEERIALVAAGAGRSGGASRAGGLDCRERDRTYPPEFFCQIHGDNRNYDTSDCIVLREEFVMLYPEFMEYRRRRQGAAAPIGGRGSGRGMDDPLRQLLRLDSGASWSRGRPTPPPQRAGSGPGGHNGLHGGRGFEDYRLLSTRRKGPRRRRPRPLPPG